MSNLLEPFKFVLLGQPATKKNSATMIKIKGKEKNEKVKQIKEVVNKIKHSKTTAFMPDLVAKQLNIKVYKVEKALDELTMGDNPLLKVSYRFICPSCAYVKRFENFKELIKWGLETEECPFCEKHLDVDLVESNAYKFYKFNNESRIKEISL